MFYLVIFLFKQNSFLSVFVCVCVHLWRPEEGGPDSLELELQVVVSQNQSLLEEQQAFLTAKPTPPLHFPFDVPSGCHSFLGLYRQYCNAALIYMCKFLQCMNLEAWLWNVVVLSLASLDTGYFFLQLPSLFSSTIFIIISSSLLLVLVIEPRAFPILEECFPQR